MLFLFVAIKTLQNSSPKPKFSQQNPELLPPFPSCFHGNPDISRPRGQEAGRADETLRPDAGVTDGQADDTTYRNVGLVAPSGPMAENMAKSAGKNGWFMVNCWWLVVDS